MRLPAKKEAFCLAFLEVNSASEAYRMTHDTSKMKPESVHTLASKLFNEVAVTSRLKNLRAPIIEKALITFESHLERLNQLSLAAESAEQFGAAITAETNRGRAAGLYVERVDNTSSDGSMSPTRIELVAPSVDS
jgi:phage terminase small subunit